MKKRTVSFINKPNDGVTVAMIGGKDSTLPIDALNLLMNFVRENSRYIALRPDSEKLEELTINHTYKGVAKCAPEDIYTEHEGQAIAEDRCRENYKIAIDKRLVKFLNDVYRLEFALEQLLIERGVVDENEFNMEDDE